MADNTLLNSGSGGDTARTVQKGTPKAAVCIIDWGGPGAESLTTPDFATQTTLAALNAKVTAVNTGAVVLAAGSAVIGHVIVDSAPSTAVTGSVTANAGTNLNTSLLAIETGGNLAGINTKTPALGQALAAASVPVVLTALQVAALTPPAAISGYALDATLTGGSQKTVSLPVRGAITNRSGTIATGGTSQVLAASNASRSYLFILNPKSATESLWIDFGTAAVAASPSIELQPGQSFTMEQRFASTDAVNVVAATSAHGYTAKEG